MRIYTYAQSGDEEDLLAFPDPPKYDLIIGNPPYLRVMRDDPSAIAMPTVVHGAPNLYFLFASMSLFNLKDSAEISACHGRCKGAYTVVSSSK